MGVFVGGIDKYLVPAIIRVKKLNSESSVCPEARVILGSREALDRLRQGREYGRESQEETMFAPKIAKKGGR